MFIFLFFKVYLIHLSHFVQGVLDTYNSKLTKTLKSNIQNDMTSTFFYFKKLSSPKTCKTFKTYILHLLMFLIQQYELEVKIKCLAKKKNLSRKSFLSYLTV